MGEGVPAPGCAGSRPWLVSVLCSNVLLAPALTHLSIPTGFLLLLDKMGSFLLSDLLTLAFCNHGKSFVFVWPAHSAPPSLGTNQWHFLRQQPPPHPSAILSPA